MKLHFLTLIGLLTFAANAHSRLGTADRTSYILTLSPQLPISDLDKCVEKICELSGNKAFIQCEIVSERFRIVAASLSNSSAKKVTALACVKSLRPERSDIKAQPRSGRSN